MRTILTFRYVFCLSKKKKKAIYGGGGEDVAETKQNKTLVHRTAVKQISTHGDQENVKKYALLRTLLATWNLLRRINTANATSFW